MSKDSINHVMMLYFSFSTKQVFVLLYLSFLLQYLCLLLFLSIYFLKKMNRTSPILYINSAEN